MNLTPTVLPNTILTLPSVDGNNIQSVIPADESGNMYFTINLTKPIGRTSGVSLQEYADQICAGNLANYPTMTREQFSLEYSSSPEDMAIAENFILSSGLTLLKSDSTCSFVKASGTIAQINAAFSTTIHLVQTTATSYYTYDGSLTVPQALSEVVSEILGLDLSHEFKRYKAHSLTPTPVTTSLDNSDNNPITTPNVAPGTKEIRPASYVASAYNFPANTTASNVVVGIVEFASAYNIVNLNTTFKTFYGMSSNPAISFQLIGSAGYSATFDRTTPTSSELMLDVAVVGSAAPYANIEMYINGDPAYTVNFAETINAAIAGESVYGVYPAVLSISYGSAEGSFSTVETALQTAVLLGTTVVVSSGDQGSLNPSGTLATEYPASSSYVLAVGGTSLYTVTATNSITSETVWNNWYYNWNALTGNNGGASGGGISQVYSAPSYQTNAGITFKTWNTNTSGAATVPTGRAVPDVAANADGYTGYTYTYDAIFTATSAPITFPPTGKALTDQFTLTIPAGQTRTSGSGKNLISASYVYVYVSDSGFVNHVPSGNSAVVVGYFDTYASGTNIILDFNDTTYGYGNPNYPLYNSIPAGSYTYWTIQAYAPSTGGTSASAPLWAALIARCCMQIGCTNLGFLNSVLYQNPQAFHDITSGDNQWNSSDPAISGWSYTQARPGYLATTGWDACTGLGSPKGDVLFSVIQNAIQLGTLTPGVLYNQFVPTGFPISLGGVTYGNNYYASAEKILYDDGFLNNGYNSTGSGLISMNDSPVRRLAGGISSGASWSMSSLYAQLGILTSVVFYSTNYVVVGGGGGGASSPAVSDEGGGGGGAGGWAGNGGVATATPTLTVFEYDIPVFVLHSNATYTVYVGASGAAGASGGGAGGQGGNSGIYNASSGYVIEVVGGGGGASGGAGANGGSGGGGSGAGSDQAGGSSQYGTVINYEIPGQNSFPSGFNGATGPHQSYGGGGGGAGGATSGPTPGTGISVNLSGAGGTFIQANMGWGGGGGGSFYDSSGGGATYGTGNDGQGGESAGYPYGNGQPQYAPYYGGGGGGNYSQQTAAAGAGAPGVVVIVYVSATQLFSGGTVTSTGSGASTTWQHVFTSTGTLTGLTT